MEYNELITKAQQASVDAPDTNAILSGMRHTLQRRQRHQQVVLSAALVLVVCVSVFFMQPRYESHVTLAEYVSAKIDTPPTRTPAPLVGYRHSMYNRQIYTLL